MPDTIDLGSYGIAAIVLAAGRSSRMGDSHKLLLPLSDGRTVLQHAVAGAFSLHPAQLVVVTQPDMAALLAVDLPSGVEVVPNPDYAAGMASSMRVGIMALRPEVRAVLVLLGDEPQVSAEIIRSLLAAYERDQQSVTIPVYGDVPGPPTLFRRAVFSELLQLEGDEGGRAVVQRDPSRVSKVLLSAELMPSDLDTPEDYTRFLHHKDTYP